jgi:hypothetical protein
MLAVHSGFFGRLFSEAGFTVFNLLVFAATPAGMTGWLLLTPERFQGLIVRGPRRPI